MTNRRSRPYTSRINQPRRDDLPSISATALRRTGAINRETTIVELMFENRPFTLRVSAIKFPNGGYWNQFLCPSCGRLTKVIRLLGDRVVCTGCDGLIWRSQIDNIKGLARGPQRKDATIIRLIAKLETPKTIKRVTKADIDNKPAIVRRLRQVYLAQREERLIGHRQVIAEIKREYKPRRKKTPNGRERAQKPGESAQ
jgi:hypothetical protein